MPTGQSTDIQFSQLLDALPDAVVWFRALRNETNQLVNFQIGYSNQKAKDSAREIYQVSTGTLVLGGNKHDQSLMEQLFRDLSGVMKSGQPHEFTYFNKILTEWFVVNQTKLGDGVLHVTRNATAWKKAEQEKLEQTELLQTILDTSLNNVFVYKAIRDELGHIQDFRVELANPTAQQDVMARHNKEILGNTLLSFMPNSRATGQFTLFCQVIESGKPIRSQHFYPDVQEWYDTSITKLGDGCVVTGINITKQKQGSLDNKQQADLLQTVINNSPTALVLYEPIRNEEGEVVDFRYKLANPIAAKATGLTLDYMQGNTLLAMFPKAAQKGFLDRLVNVLQTGTMQTYEHHFADDGVDLWAEVTMVRQGNDVLTVFQYITELKRTQQQLEHSRADLQTVIDTSQTGIFLFSPVRSETGEVVDFRFRSANRQLASYVGQEPDAIIGALGSTYFPDYKSNGLFDLYRKTYVTGESQRFDFHYDGTGIDAWLDILATKIGDEVLVTFGDYTPLKRLQQQLEALVMDLQRSNRNLEQFAYVASHDLQEPLRKIQAFGDILKAQYAPTIGDAGADIIQRMQSAAARMQVLIKDVLAYSRVSTKREAHKPVDLNTIVAEVLGDLETSINEKRALVTIGRLPTVHGDIPQLRQLFQNLISNALKFDKPGRIPELTIVARSVWGRDAGTSFAIAKANRMFHLIEVADNGIGFEPQYAERIFQVFQRLHSRNEYQGTGVGLAIVQKVVENHEGYIEADGRPDQGATFRVLLPYPSN